MCKPYSHIAPELHGGDRQSKASDVYSFGAKAQHVLKDGNCTSCEKVSFTHSWKMPTK